LTSAAVDGALRGGRGARADDPIALTALDVNHAQETLAKRSPYDHHVARYRTIIEIDRHRIRE